MYYIIHIFYGLILAAAILGYALLWKAKTKLPICFFPITAISGMTVCVYIFGLLGFLKIGCVVVTLGGFLCLWRYRSWHNIKSIFCDWSIWFYIFATIWLFLVTRHSCLAHYDDFSHWYRICKAMNYDGTYPTTPDIKFYTYVPGTATWIYLVTRFIGFSVSNCFFSQGLINIACLLCFFSAITKFNNKIICLIISVIIILVGIMSWSFIDSTYTLLVDSLVGLMPLATLIIILYADNIKQLALPICLISAYIAIVKNSCLLFLLITLVLCGIMYKFNKRQWLKYISLWGFIPFVLYRLYFFRASIYYSDIVESNHAASVNRFYVLIQEKGIENILSITKNFFIRITDINNGGGITICYFLFVVFFLIFAIIKSFRNLITKDKRSFCDNLAIKMKYAIIIGIIIILTYSSSLLITYICSFSIKEANELASFPRYFSSITIYIVGGGIYLLIKEICNSSINNKVPVMFAIVLIMLFILGFVSPSKVGLFNLAGQDKDKIIISFSNDFWIAFNENIEENIVYTDNSYLVLWEPKEYRGFSNGNARMWEASTTWLRSSKIRVISNEDIAKGLDEKVLSDLSNYDYLVTLSDMSEQVEALKDYLPVQDYKVGICPISGGV